MLSLASLTFEVTCTRQRDALARRSRMSIARFAAPVWHAVARQVHRMVRLPRYVWHDDFALRRPKDAMTLLAPAQYFRAQKPCHSSRRLDSGTEPDALRGRQVQLTDFLRASSSVSRSGSRDSHWFGHQDHASLLPGTWWPCGETRICRLGFPERCEVLALE
jgi:hypothetical protein